MRIFILCLIIMITRAIAMDPLQRTEKSSTSPSNSRLVRIVYTWESLVSDELFEQFLSFQKEEELPAVRIHYDQSRFVSDELFEQFLSLQKEEEPPVVRTHCNQESLLSDELFEQFLSFQEEKNVPAIHIHYDRSDVSPEELRQLCSSSALPFRKVSREMLNPLAYLMRHLSIPSTIEEEEEEEKEELEPLQIFQKSSSARDAKIQEREIKISRLIQFVRSDRKLFRHLQKKKTTH